MLSDVLFPVSQALGATVGPKRGTKAGPDDQSRGPLGDGGVETGAIRKEDLLVEKGEMGRVSMGRNKSRLQFTPKRPRGVSGGRFDPEGLDTKVLV